MSNISISSTPVSGNDRPTFLESFEELGLARAVTADEDGKVGEVIGYEGCDGLIRMIEFDHHRVDSKTDARVKTQLPQGENLLDLSHVVGGRNHVFCDVQGDLGVP